MREAGPSDDAALAAFFAAYHGEFRHELGEQDVTGEGRRARAYYAGGAVLVAVEGGEVVGCVAYEPWGKGRPHLDGHPVRRARMKRMYVPPTHRGRGLGRVLAEAVMERARREGYDAMVLDTTGPMDAATRLYRDLGFTGFEPDYEAPCRGTLYLARAL